MLYVYTVCIYVYMYICNHTHTLLSSELVCERSNPQARTVWSALFPPSPNGECGPLSPTGVVGPLHAGYVSCRRARSFPDTVLLLPGVPDSGRCTRWAEDRCSSIGNHCGWPRDSNYFNIRAFGLLPGSVPTDSRLHWRA